MLQEYMTVMERLGNFRSDLQINIPVGGCLVSLVQCL
jgi:hypothetical protein